MRIPARGRRTGRLAKVALLPAVALLVAACTDLANTNPTGDDAAPGLFIGEVVTTQGNQAASLYLPLFIIATIVFFLVEGLLLFMAWRFRRRSSGDDLPAQTHGNNKLEIVWTVIPAIVVTALFIGSTIVLTDIQATSDDPDVVVDVEAFRFGWKFDYPDSGISIAGGGREGAPEMVLPINQTIRFNITALDVIHSFYVPSFFYKLDAIPGRTNDFEITIETPGVYGGQCAEFCGVGHGDMFFSVRAVEQDEFDAWVVEQTGGPDAVAVTTEGAS
ncbi:MAG: cytochrome c oxidase subunit II [Chloroflexota bacterium]